MLLPNLTLKVEKWKFNKDYGVHVSTEGRFKDRHKRNLPIKITNTGYCAIKTEQGYKLAHRLVMMTWCPIPDFEILTVDHLNHNKRDNSLKNLEWVTQEENLARATNDYLKESIEDKENNKDFVILNGILFSVDGAIKFIKAMPANENMSYNHIEKNLLIQAFQKGTKGRCFGFKVSSINKGK